MYGVAIGFALAAIQLFNIPDNSTYTNPAMRFSHAVFAGEKALSQKWLLYLAPVLGAIITILLWGGYLLLQIWI